MNNEVQDLLQELLATVRMQAEALAMLQTQNLTMRLMLKAVLVTQPDIKALIEAHARAMDQLTDDATAHADPVEGESVRRGAVAGAQQDHEELLSLLNKQRGNE